MSARDACRALFRHRRKSAAFFATVVTLALAGLVLMPRKYLSEAKFLVKVNMRVDPTATHEGPSLNFDLEREAEMRSVVALLQSRVLLERVVDQLGPELILEMDLNSTIRGYLPHGIWPRLTSGARPDATLQREKAIQHLGRTLQIEHPKRTHVVALAYKSRSPARAQRVLEAYVAAGLRQHVELDQNPEAFRFFDEQQRLLESQVLRAKEELRDVKNQVGLVSVASQRNVLEGHLLSLDRQLLDAGIERAATDDRISALQSQLPFELQRPVSVSALSIRSLDEMRNQLFSLELRHRELSSRCHENHPEVLALQEQVAEARLVLNQQQLLNELSTAAALQSKLAALQVDCEETKAKLRKLNEDEVRVVELERRTEELTAHHRACVKKLEQARLDLQLGSDQISNLRLVQAPTYMGKALSRRGALIAGLALMVGLLGAVGVAYVAELLDDSLATPVDIESELGLPVLISLPRLPAYQVELN